MSLAFLRTLVLVTLGAFVAGHVLVRWAARKADREEIVPSLAIGFSSIALGLALNEPGTLAFAVELGALGLLVTGLLTLARRKLRRAP
jgi:Na+/proline symporter